MNVDREVEAAIEAYVERYALAVVGPVWDEGRAAAFYADTQIGRLVLQRASAGR
jgi:hypothetical protein